MDATTIALAASLLVEEAQASRIETVAHTPVDTICDAMRSELTPHFQTAWDDPTDIQVHRTGKRMGKSEYGGRRLFRGAALNHRSVNPYICPTAKSARLRMWPIIKRIARAHFPDAKLREDLMTVTLPEGGVVVVGGCENRNDIGNWYGIPFAEAFVDECGTFPPYLRELVSDGLEPSLMDFGGRLVLAGNPGVAPIGYWHELTGPSRKVTFPLFVGDARDNPHVDAAAYFKKKLAQNGWTEAHPTFVRMYLGEWCADPSALCFPFDESRNGISKLPETSLAGGPLDKDRWRWVIAADVAGVGITAIVIMCAHPGDPRSFVWSSESYKAWLPEQLVDRVRQIKADRSHGYDMSRAAFVVDVGGLGSVHAVHLTRKAGDLFFEPAQKTDKKSSIRDVHDELLADRLQVVTSQARGLVDQFAVLEWDAAHEQWQDGPPDHEADACLYAKRRLRQYARDALPANDTSTSARLYREAARMKAAAIRRASGETRSGRPWWDR